MGFEMVALRQIIALALDIEMEGPKSGLFWLSCTMKAVRWLTLMFVAMMAVIVTGDGASKNKGHSTMGCLALSIAVSSMSWSFVTVFVVWHYDAFFVAVIALFVCTANYAAVYAIIDSVPFALLSTLAAWTAFAFYVFKLAP